MSNFRELELKELKLKNLYECTTQRIKQETNLINNRLSWLLTFQGFLFAVIALVASKDTNPAVSLILRAVIPIIGIAVALLALTGILGAYMAIGDLISWSVGEGLEKTTQYPPAYGSKLARALGMVTSYGIPLSLVITWVILLKKL